jgi:hypothetical protein
MEHQEREYFHIKDLPPAHDSGSRRRRPCDPDLIPVIVQCLELGGVPAYSIETEDHSWNSVSPYDEAIRNLLLHHTGSNMAIE